MSLKCDKCNAEYAEGSQHVCAPVENTSQKCPECGAEFDGVSISHSSEKLAALAEQNAALTGELEATKKKLAAAEAKIAQPPARQNDPPAPAAQEKKKRRPIYGESKRAAA